MNSFNNQNQAPLLGNVAERQTQWGGTEFKIGISPDGMRTLSQASNGGWGNIIVFQSKAGKWMVKLDTYKGGGQGQPGNAPRQYGQPSQQPSAPRGNYYDNPDFQPRRNPTPSTFDAPPTYGDLSRAAGAVANHTRQPETRLKHEDRVNMDEDGNLIPF